MIFWVKARFEARGAKHALIHTIIDLSTRSNDPATRGHLVTAGASQGLAQETVSIPIPKTQQQIQADIYSAGQNDNAKRGIVLAHGGRFDKTSWRKQAQKLVRTGFVVLAISFRGDGKNTDGSPGAFGSTPDNATDVLAGVEYLHKRGIKRVSAIGGSMGGDAVGGGGCTIRARGDRQHRAFRFFRRRLSCQAHGAQAVYCGA
jgi:predicted alpha/beta hydrolase